MGFFESLGRKVGEFTHEAKQAADEGASYVCTDCGERFYTDQGDCPACGSDAVVEREPPDTASEAVDTDGSTESDTHLEDEAALDDET
ncbi:PhlB family protein [Natrarchaeobaculum sulfurireducens]|uniref:OB-fold domain and Zn-ribbon containing protein,possible acyl-CoA-binding protein n=1 Tax=Natrarchaeobaculum sulfurireducens TaxID=2044521 RepID=A0A346PL07_9EURY|nr:zinc ribbon domain-containing protein [Natrarchaeobaculum sulfurireducens]AXR76525.1 OB-fold domain and Zn-ribbon containing protein,possible acyl-CoA-binding protein [Natrarchaeobaculum sulfurireducens]AXR80202.1 hypothetical protein AArcMg_0179 [Natrarchaeobaculum sulfurireducens]